MNLPKEIADDWVIILDESIGIGQEKVLVVMGMRESRINFSRPLQIQELQPLLVKSRERWTGEMIAQELEHIKPLVGKIKYAVSDAGCSIKKGLSISQLPQVFDITHSIANMLEKLYKNDKQFVEFSSKAGQMRFRLCCSKHAHLIPPNQRSKSRFLNIDIIVKWGKSVLNVLKQPNLLAEIGEHLEWVEEYKDLVMEMYDLMEIITEISIILKHNGLSQSTKSDIISLLKKCKTAKQQQFAEYMAKYLEQNSRNLKNEKDKILCCSDIIETTFGRYKNELSKNLMCGITDIVLFIPAITSKLDVESINAALESVKVKDIERWKQENLCNSLISNRLRIFNNKVA